MKHTFSKGGIHPAPNKTASTKIELQPLPMIAVVPLSQHIGPPAKAVVAKGDVVVRGQLIAEAASFVSARLHAPISGTVTAVEKVVMPDGKPSPAVIIKASEAEHAADTEAREAYWRSMDTFTPAPDNGSGFIRRTVSEAGIVGLGGATFPTHVKLAESPHSHAQVLIINGGECEPYLTCDDALMQTRPWQIATGVQLCQRALGVNRVVIAIEDNKPQAIEAMRDAARGMEGLEVMVMKTKYPQGGEKQIIEAVTGMRMPSGALPMEVGAVVVNVATAFAVYQAVTFGQPLIERVITVTGDIPEAERKNYLAAIGTPLEELPFTLPANARAILGGPMMGRSAVRLDAPVTKGSSGLLLLSTPDTVPEQPCIRCAACVSACPMGLEPYLLAAYARHGMWEETKAAAATDCLECGSCNYVCPSHRPLVEFIRIAKRHARK